MVLDADSMPTALVVDGATGWDVEARIWSGEALRWWRHAALARVGLGRVQTTPKPGDNVVRSLARRAGRHAFVCGYDTGAATGKGEFPATGSGPR